MAMLIASPLSKVQRNQRNLLLRKRREAIEEMRRNGVVISPAWARAVDDPEPELPALNVADIGRDDFISAPDAKPMSDADVANVVSLSVAELQNTLAAVAKRLGRAKCVNAYSEFSEAKCDWPADDERWSLTPHALRRLAALA